MQITILSGKETNPGDNPWTPLESLGKLTVYDLTKPEQTVERAKDADILLVGRDILTTEHIEQLPKLKCIGVLGTGYNQIDIETAGKRGIPVINVTAYGVEAVAQHAFALLLELCRHTAALDQAVRDGAWSSPDWAPWKYPQVELTYKCFGIIGYGNIGQKAGYIAHGFDMSVLAYDERPVQPPSYTPFSLADLDEVFRNADVLSLHCPLTEDNFHLVNKKRIETMKDGAIIINVARGALLDEQAVADALISGKLGGLGSDAFIDEPINLNNPLLSAPNTVFTPHIAWESVEARRNIVRILAENLKAWMDGKPQSIVNKEYLVNS